VRLGQVLATLDPTTFQAAVDSAQANLRLAEANLNSAQVSVGKMKALLDMANLTVEREEPLLKQGLINQNQMDTDRTAAISANQDYLAAQAAVRVAEAQVSVAQGQLATAKYNLATVYIINRVEAGEYPLAIAYSTVLIFFMLAALLLVQKAIGEARLGRRAVLVTAQ
jgi:multidrug resistance efflux pump